MSTGVNVSAARRVTAVVARVVAASLGGYALAVASAYFVARVLPTSRAEASTAASIIAVLIMPTAAVWAVAAPSAWRAIGGVTLAVALLGGGAWLLGPHA